VANDCDLEQSWAYSDSYYDLPLLTGVGNPVAVNPDPRLAIAATARRWPIRFLDAPEGVVKVAGVEPQQALLPFLRPETIPYARFDIAGTEHVPSEGGAIVAANHRSYFDVLALGVTLARAGRLGRFLGKREVFSAPVVGQVAAALGGIPVDRGSGSDEPLKAAATALDAGEVVVILPQGTIPRGADFFEPVMSGRPGVARLAAMTGAPVVPISLWGTERVWPRSARLPNMVNVLRPPTIRVRVGEPLPLPDGIDEIDGTELVMSSIFDLMPAEAKTRREPSAADLARTYPPGHSAADEDG
jgi:putative phosphoserine phosphatase/1-acylglycerol-3-phosphate O-acyltransferase